MTASIIALFAFFRFMEPLVLTESEIAALSSEAREVVVQRQRLIGFTQKVIPWMSTLGFCAGGGLAFWAGHKWNSRQVKDDQALDEERAFKSRQYGMVPEGQVRELHADEAAEELKVRLEDASALVVNHGGKESLGDSRVPKESEFTSSESIMGVRNSIGDQIRRIDERWHQLLRLAYGEVFEVRGWVSEKSSPSTPFHMIDALLDPPQKSGLSQLAFEIKFTAVRKNIRNAIMRGLAAAAPIGTALAPGDIYSGRPGPNLPAKVAVIVVIVISSDESMTDKERRSLRATVEKYNTGLIRPVAVMAVTEKRLGELDPELLRDQVAPLWAGVTSFTDLG